MRRTRSSSYFALLVLDVPDAGLVAAHLQLGRRVEVADLAILRALVNILSLLAGRSDTQSRSQPVLP